MPTGCCLAAAISPGRCLFVCLLSRVVAAAAAVSRNKNGAVICFFFLHKNFETLAFIYLFIIIFCLLFLDWFGLDCGSV